VRVVASDPAVSLVDFDRGDDIFTSVSVLVGFEVRDGRRGKLPDFRGENKG
jgi:hypothetical protein